MSGFTKRWAELTKEGWKSRRPTGLSDDHTYLRPGKTKKDLRGVVYFAGAEELMAYLDEIELAAARNDTAAQRGALGHGGDNIAEAGASDEPAVSFDGAVLEHEAATSNGGDTEASNREAVACDGREGDAAAVLEREVVVSAGDASSTAHEPEASANEGGATAPECDAAAPSTPSAEINIVQNNDDPNEYGAMESDVEKDDGASDDDDSTLANGDSEGNEDDENEADDDDNLI
ncbi:hypothetical protein PF005_g25990 [Phytophthora fragariae]|uniref:Uncharacterized protein n=2 Tax=Phytophthora fragariae TaxID=53985 RepID=A0A6A4BHW9_9STRA|nr:hypothetical protein PF006_g24880 [Phytophthora fragariae]KAE9174114.1 hypothetical protein PF005_g25990 [Phytophthora fragariae]KAE9273264.1 hypothetical protein PF001_g27584 [Phytophthora fragariae]